MNSSFSAGVLPSLTLRLKGASCGASGGGCSGQLSSTSTSAMLSLTCVSDNVNHLVCWGASARLEARTNTKVANGGGLGAR